MTPATKSAVRFGTIVTALIALLPYVSDFFISAYQSVDLDPFHGPNCDRGDLRWGFGAPSGILGAKLFQFRRSEPK